VARSLKKHRFFCKGYLGMTEALRLKAIRPASGLNPSGSRLKHEALSQIVGAVRIIHNHFQFVSRPSPF